MKNNFDEVIDRKLSKCRKWDNSVLKNKFGLNEDAIPMDLADLDFECAPAIKKALLDRASLGDYGYTYCTDDYYDAVINWNKRRYNLHVEKEWIRLTFGTCGTLHYLVQCFCKPGESVMINTPAYAPFAEAVEHGGCNLVCNPLMLENMRYYLDFDLIEKQFIDEQVKLFIFCSPQNPSGRVWTKDELNQLSDLCIKYKVLLVSDEIHRDILFDRSSFTTVWNSNDSIADYSITCVSPNKGFNLGGLKSSYVLIKNDKMRQKFYNYLQRVYVTSPHVFAIPALVAAYNDSEEWLDELTEYIKGNFDIVYNWFETYMPHAKVMKSDSSFLAWIDVSEIFKNENEMIDFFTKANIAVVVGSYFVQDSLGWVRLNIGTQRSILIEALDRMGKVYTK